MKIGIVGSGKISERHILAYQALGYNEIAVYDIDKVLAEEAANKFGIAHMKSLDALMRPDVQLIDVCTPVTTHKDIILKALEHDKHVFCEKPLCQNIQEAYAIKSAAEKSAKLVMIGYLYRFHPGIQQVKKWLDSNIIGQAHFGLFRIGGRGNHRKWKHIKKLGGGCINEMLIHVLDLVYFFFGKIDVTQILMKEILLKNRTIDGSIFEPDAEDNVLVKLKAGGASIICQADFTSPSYMEYLEIHGDNGSIFTSILSYFPTLLFLKEPSGIYNQGNNMLNFSQVNLFELELEHFLACIQNGVDNNINSIDESIEVMNIVTEIKRSNNDTDSRTYCH